jgi:hypothetical protein
MEMLRRIVKRQERAVELLAFSCTCFILALWQAKRVLLTQCWELRSIDGHHQPEALALRKVLPGVNRPYKQPTFPLQATATTVGRVRLPILAEK